MADARWQETTRLLPMITQTPKPHLIPDNIMVAVSERVSVYPVWCDYVWKCFLWSFIVYAFGKLFYGESYVKFVMPFLCGKSCVLFLSAEIYDHIIIFAVSQKSRNIMVPCRSRPPPAICKILCTITQIVSNRYPSHLANPLVGRVPRLDLLCKVIWQDLHGH